MTLIVGAHLGNGVGLIGDTRVAVTYSNNHVEFFDDCQKIYNLVSCIFGFAGDLQAAHFTIARFVGRSLYDLSPAEAIHKCSQPAWIESELKQAYSEVIREHSDLATRRFGLVLANEDTTLEPSEAALPAGPDNWLVLDNTIASKARALGSKSDCRFCLVSILFPEGNTRVLKPGEVVCLGSGSYIDDVLQIDEALVLPGVTGGQPWQRFASLMGNYQTALNRVSDETFNLIEHALFMSERRVETMFTTFNHWPEGGRPQDDYTWTAMSAQQREWGDQMFGNYFRFSTDFSQEIHECFIYDHELARTLPMRMISKVLGDLPVAYRSANG